MYKAKYFAKKCVVDGIEFASKKESERYLVLKSQERQGLIFDLQMQVPFVLIPAQYETVKSITKRGKEKISKKLIERECRYIADFVYQRDGETVVEDTKGYKKGGAYATYTLKRKMMLYFHGIRIVEV